MDFAAVIIAGHSIGTIELGASIARYLSEIYAEGHQVKLSVYDNPGVKLHSYQIDSGIITINTDEAGMIISISCRQPYAGTYQGKLWPGMTVEQVKQHTAKQLLTCGALVADGELGVFLTLPAPYDEFDYPKQLPDSLVLETLYVMPRNWRGY